MLRLNPVGYYRFVQASQFESSYAGGEANVAVSLANYGMSAAFVTKDSPSMRCGSVCRQCPAAVSGSIRPTCTRGGSRLGVYYCRKGRLTMRPSEGHL